MTRSSLGRCCIHSAIMLEMADKPLPEHSNRDNVIEANKGQANLLRKAAELADEMQLMLLDVRRYCPVAVQDKITKLLEANS